MGGEYLGLQLAKELIADKININRNRKG